MPVEEISQQLAPFVEAFERLPEDPLRRAAFDRFLEAGFPNSHDEDWKFTNLNPLARTNFEVAAPARTADVAERLIPAFGPDAATLVFVNGYFAPFLSNGAMVGDEFPEIRAAGENKPFIALNRAFCRDVARVHVPAKMNGAGEPLYIIHLSVPNEHPTFSNPHNQVVVEREAQASVIECYLGDGKYFTNALTEIVAGDGAIVDHYKIQRESNQAFHISTVQIAQGRDSVVTSRSFAFGGALARTEIIATLDQGSECTLNGLYLVDGHRHVDTRTTIDHAKPHATSHELYKGILDGRSSAVFNGKILVRKDAQKTDAKQTNKNLVLSEDATINTKPQLEIFADDVRCTHGATVGQLDSESIFYLRSRGIGLDEARSMLIEAFAREIIDGVKIAELRDYLGRHV